MSRSKKIIYAACSIFVSLVVLFSYRHIHASRNNSSDLLSGSSAVCTVPEKIMLRPTGVFYYKDKLYLLGRSYENFYSVDLSRPHCTVTQITGGQDKGFVVPLSVFHYKRDNSWYIADPAKGIIVVPHDGSSHILDIADPVTKDQLDPTNGFAEIDKNHLAVVNYSSNNIININMASETAAVLSSDSHGAGPHMQAPIGVAFINNSLYALDYKLKSIFKINPKTGDRKVFVKLNYSADSQNKSEQPFNLYALKINGMAYLLVSDPQSKTISKINIGDRSISVLTDNRSKHGATWMAPLGMSFDGKRTLFVTDYAGNAVYSVNVNTGMKHKLIAMQAKDSAPHLVFPAQIMLAEHDQLLVGDERLPGIFKVNPKTSKLKLITAPNKGTGPIMLEVIALNTLSHGDPVFSDTVLAQYFTVDANGNRHAIVMSPSIDPVLDDPWGLIKNSYEPHSWFITDGGGGYGNIFMAHINEHNYTISRKLISSNAMSQHFKLDNTLGLAVLSKNKIIVANSILSEPTSTNKNIIAIDPKNGSRKLFSGTYGDEKVGTGPDFKSVTWLLLNRNNELYVSDFLTPAIFSVNIETGDRQYVYKGKPFKIISGFALSHNQDVMYINDVGLRAIFSLDLNTKKTKLIVKSK